MTDTTIGIDRELLDDLKLLKGVLEQANMTGTIRRIMTSAGYTEAFFEKMEELLNRREDGTD